MVLYIFKCTTFICITPNFTRRPCICLSICTVKPNHLKSEFSPNRPLFHHGRFDFLFHNISHRHSFKFILLIFYSMCRLFYSSILNVTEQFTNKYRPNSTVRFIFIIFTLQRQDLSSILQDCSHMLHHVVLTNAHY